MINFAATWFPDWAWDLYRWTVNHNRARTRYPNPVQYVHLQREIRRMMWGRS